MSPGSHNDDRDDSEAVPTVSVCIPAYEGAAFIGLAIKSVLAQTFTDFELLVADDGSTDATLDVVRSFTDPRIRIVGTGVNVGAEANWNRCLASARGKYVKLLPQDDLLGPECLAQQVGVMEQDLSLSFAFCARAVIDGGGRRYFRRGYPAKSGRLSGQAIVRACVRAGTNLIGEPGAVLMRREHAAAIGQFDGSSPYVIDLNYWFRLLTRGDAHYLDLALASFRVSNESWSVRIGRSQTEQFLSLVDRVKRENNFSISGGDVKRARVRARWNSILRRLFYAVVIRG